MVTDETGWRGWSEGQCWGVGGSPSEVGVCVSGQDTGPESPRETDLTRRASRPAPTGGGWWWWKSSMSW